MHLSTTLSALLPAALASSTPSPGYDCHPHCIASTVPANQTLSFGTHYAVLNLDLINLVVGGVAGTPAGDAFIHNTAAWIAAVHAQTPAPLTIFTRVYFSNSRQPELADDTPFKRVAGVVGGPSDNRTFVYPAFHVDEKAGDLVFQKSRYYAGTANALEEILATQKIDTVIVSGLRTSGVVLSTAYRLFDLDYKVYVIANNTFESAPDNGINGAILEGIIPKLPADVITIEQAIAGLKNSGPAVY